MKDKLAEEILAKFIEKLDYSYRYKTVNERKNIINKLHYLMQAYHEVANKQVMDEDIQKYAASAVQTSRGKLSPLIETGIIWGAKAFRDGEIKHNEKMNDSDAYYSRRGCEHRVIAILVIFIVIIILL